MGRCRASLSHFSRFAVISQSLLSRTSYPQVLPRLEPLNSFPSPLPRYDFLHFRSFSALPAQSPIYSDEFEPVTHHFGQNYHQPFEPSKDDEDFGKISVRAFFLCTRGLAPPSTRKYKRAGNHQKRQKERQKKKKEEEA